MEKIIRFDLLRNKGTLNQPNEEAIKAPSFVIRK
jgi:hypothetical protein